MGNCCSSNIKEKSNKDVIELDELGVELEQAQPKALPAPALTTVEQPKAADDGIVYAEKGTVAGDIDRATMRKDEGDEDGVVDPSLKALSNSVLTMLDEATSPRKPDSALMQGEEEKEEDFDLSEITDLPMILNGERVGATIQKRDGMVGLALDAVEFVDEQWEYRTHPSTGRKYVFNVDSKEKCWKKPPGEIVVIDGFFDGAPAEALVKSGQLQVGDVLLEVNGKEVLGHMTITDLSKLIGDKRKKEVSLVVSRSAKMQEKFKSVMAEKESYTQNEASSMHQNAESTSMPSRELEKEPSIIMRGSI